MQKLKKLVSSFICFAILIALAGSLGYEPFATPINNNHLEVSKPDSHALFNVCMISEECDDTHDNNDFSIPAATNFLLVFSFLNLRKIAIFLRSFNGENSIQQNSLFILFRSFRI